MSRDAFYQKVAAELFRGSLPPWQQEPLDALINEGARLGRSIQDIAYVLATAYHETARFKFKEEIGKGEGKAYGEPVAYMGTGSRVTETRRFYGRGPQQLTWLSNYVKDSIAATLAFGREINLVENPELMVTDENIRAFSIWNGMIKGSYTGKNLADFISTKRVDYVGARKIINGTDKDELIAGYAEQFEEALKLLGDAPAVSDCSECGRALA